MINRQGVTTFHMDDVRDEQALRIRAVELAIELGGYAGDTEGLVKSAEEILAFIMPEQPENGTTVSTAEGSSSGKDAPKSKLVHFAS